MKKPIGDTILKSTILKLIGNYGRKLQKGTTNFYITLEHSKPTTLSVDDASSCWDVSVLHGDTSRVSNRETSTEGGGDGVSCGEVLVGVSAGRSASVDGWVSESSDSSCQHLRIGLWFSRALGTGNTSTFLGLGFLGWGNNGVEPGESSVRANGRVRRHSSDRRESSVWDLSVTKILWQGVSADSSRKPSVPDSSGWDGSWDGSWDSSYCGIVDSRAGGVDSSSVNHSWIGLWFCLRLSRALLAGSLLGSGQSRLDDGGDEGRVSVRSSVRESVGRRKGCLNPRESSMWIRGGVSADDGSVLSSFSRLDRRDHP